jgi:predicted nucleic acid-binding protein
VIVVSDNSVLSCLAEIGELSLLRRLYGKITITETIRHEAMHAGAPGGLRALFLAVPDWITVVSDTLPYLEETGALDAGEASAISLAWQYRDSCLLILDEKRGRRVATALGLRITGTAGLLTDAAAAGLVDFEDVFARLAKTEFRLSPQLVEALRCGLADRRPPMVDGA